MSNVIETGFIFFILLVGGYIAFGSLLTTHTINAGDCAYNATGGLENCSLSNNDFKLINNTATQAANTFNTFSQINWVIGLALLVSVCMTFMYFTKR